MKNLKIEPCLAAYFASKEHLGEKMAVDLIPHKEAFNSCVFNKSITGFFGGSLWFEEP